MEALRVRNIKLFLLFRILFNARFYYPVFTVFFLDFGISLEEFAILNSIWAVTIVLLEVPTGALADSLGRRAMIRISSILITLEMLVLLFLPIGDEKIVFWGFLLNRIISGAAEAFSSGADEAFAYDSLKSRGLESEWPQVLKRLMRFQSLAFIAALLIGSFLYDASALNYVLGAEIVSAELSMRLPIIMMLGSCLVLLFASFSMEEIHEKKSKGFVNTAKTLLSNIAASAAWIRWHRSALMLITAGMIFDCVIRLFLTLNSEYYREISYPTWSFGILGASLSLLGVLMPTLSNWLVKNKSEVFNFLGLAVLILIGLVGISFLFPIWGIIPVALLYICMYNLNFMLSHYLNQEAKSELRATILSFKSLSFNLAYGLIGIIYSVLTNRIEAESTQEVFRSSLIYLPIFFLFFSLIYCAFFWSRGSKPRC
jgi:MFS family permease